MYIHALLHTYIYARAPSVGSTPAKPLVLSAAKNQKAPTLRKEAPGHATRHWETHPRHRNTKHGSVKVGRIAKRRIAMLAGAELGRLEYGFGKI